MSRGARRTLLTPLWVLTHVAMAVAVVVMVLLGLWQLDRLDQKEDLNAEIEARMVEPVARVTDLVSVGDPYSVGERIRYRLVRAEGSYESADEILVRNRSLNGSPGYWVLTPLTMADGSAVVVNRGWVPFGMGPGMSRADADPPRGPIAIVGLARETVTAGALQSSDSESGRLESLARVDLARYAAQLPYPTLPVFIELREQSPAQPSTLPVVLPEPELDEGPHLSYAVQWFVFASIAACGYPLVLRRLAQREGRAARPSKVPVEYLE